MKRIVVLILMCFFMVSFCYAQATPEDLKTQAFNKVKVAEELVKRGQDLLAQAHTKDNVTDAFKCYLDAGQLFEQAGNALKTLGTKYATQADVDNCFRAAQYCVETMKNIRNNLGVK